MTVPFDSPNNRIFYACQAVFIEERNTEEGNSGNPTTNSTFLDGVQSVGVSSDNPANALTDIGRVERRYIQYGQQTIEITIDRVINKQSDFFYTPASYSTAYNTNHFLHADNFGSKGAKDNNNKVLRNYDITILYGPDQFNRFYQDVSNPGGEDADARDVISVTYPNCLITNINYSIGVDGVRESITLRTKNIKYNDDYSDITQYTWPSEYTGTFANRTGQSGNILKRQDFDLTDSEQYDVGLLVSTQYGKSVLPTEVIQLFNWVDGSDNPELENGLQKIGIQSVSIDVSIDYTELTDIGKWRGSEDTKEYEQNRWSIVNLPVSITCSFTGVLRQSLPYYKFLSANLNKVRNVDNIYTKSLGGQASTDWQEADRQIKLVALGVGSPQEYYIWDLGKKNYLTSIEYTGGEAGGGGNVEATINYTNQYSDFVLAKSTTVEDVDSEFS
jgi:hypothetical protein